MPFLGLTILEESISHVSHLDEASYSRPRQASAIKDQVVVPEHVGTMVIPSLPMFRKDIRPTVV